jgi:CRP/FNR family cyclic AMP-dependent transcriptional regulator
MSPTDSLWGNLFKEKNDARRGITSLLKQIPLFGDLRKAELRAIECLVHHRQYKNGEVVFWEDEPGVCMYIVQKGEVGIFKDYAKAGQRELARLEAGDFFGEMALLEDDCRSATAVALGETSLFGLNHPDLFNLFNRKPQLGVKLLSSLANILARRLRRTNQDLLLARNTAAEAAEKKAAP